MSRRGLRTAGLVLLAALAVLATPAARAASSCTVTAVGVNFGLYDPASSAPNDSAGSVTVSCTNQPPPGNETVGYAIALSAGNSGDAASRWLSAGASRIDYNLFTNASHTQVWGDGGTTGITVGGALRVTGRRTLSATHSIYGRIPARQDPAPGTYTDTIVVTLVF